MLINEFFNVKIVWRIGKIKSLIINVIVVMFVMGNIAMYIWKLFLALQTLQTAIIRSIQY